MKPIKINSPKWLSLDDLPNERWKDINGYEGLYQISDYGRVKSLSRLVKVRNTYTHRRIKSRILKVSINKSTKYPIVNLHTLHGKDKVFYLHRLVGEHFIKNKNNLPVVMHNDDDKNNTHYSNLKWGTYQENIQDAYDNGLHKSRQRSVYKISKDGRNIVLYASISEASRDTGIGITSIANCLSGLHKTAGSYIWKYENERND